ncbi:sugar ABC transporter permease [Paenibacillus glucanolyticus]|jgi:multiple sugar transport system permease protein|nr:ABC transporter permease [Paenibacillus glucanolyticus]AVV55425.1 sugar ABC transporter permease [Paenibacillus glucanolyticus]MPY15739.1 sugar ABC transporter permease [Paenibacillus glucanolyticus]
MRFTCFIKEAVMRKSKSDWAGYLYIMPWLLGLLLFTIGPMLFSLLLAFSKWDIITGVQSIEWVGLDNFKAIFHDELFYQSLKVTFIFALISVPLYQIVSLLIAVLLNMRSRGMNVFRLIYFMPSVIPAVAVSMMWVMIFNPEYGILNKALGWFGIQGPAWLQDPSYALGALIVMGIWGVGNTIIIYLSGLQSVPEDMHEAAELDGAGRIRRFFSITLPMISPTVFFNLIMGIIGGFQYFTQAFVMTNGGPLNSTLFYNLYLYNKAFQDYEMGYASALSWILFVIILVFTLIVIRSSSMWVYYQGDDDKD